MNEELKAFLTALSERIGGDPDKVLTPSQFAARTGMSVSMQKLYRKTNPVIAEAFFPLGANDWRITMRRWWRAQDKLAALGAQIHSKRKAA